MNNNKPIGIFDSGIGGLTIFKEIERVLPHENLIYLGDTLRVPYGSRNKEEIVKFSLELTQYLLQQDVKMLVVACNSISANALSEIKKATSIPIVEVISPTVTNAARQSKTKHIAVMGTTATVNSGIYKSLLSKKGINLTSIQCPLLVPLIESGKMKNDHTRKVVRRYLANLDDLKIDTLILGCTHYPLLKKVVKKELRSGITIIDSAIPTADEVMKLLQQESLDNKQSKNGFRRILLTNASKKSRDVARIFLGKSNLEFVKIRIDK